MPLSVDEQKIIFIDNTALSTGAEHYLSVEVDVQSVIESWRSSLFSFEWLSEDGDIKDLDALPPREKPKRQHVEERLRQGQPIEKPILGIGMLDNIEIGSGRAEFLTLAALGVPRMPVHIHKANKNDFKPFIVALHSGA